MKNVEKVQLSYLQVFILKVMKKIILFWMFIWNKICNRCESIMLIISQNFFIIQVGISWIGSQATFESIWATKSLSFNNQIYNLLCATFCHRSHFRAVFYLNNIYFLVDVLKHTKKIDQIPNRRIFTIFYYLAQKKRRKKIISLKFFLRHI